MNLVIFDVSQALQTLRLRAAGAIAVIDDFNTIDGALESLGRNRAA